MEKYTISSWGWDDPEDAINGTVSLTIAQQPKGFIVPGDGLDWTKKFDGSVGAVQRAAERMEITIPASGVFICSKRVSASNGYDSYFRISSVQNTFLRMSTRFKGRDRIDLLRRMSVARHKEELSRGRKANMVHRSTTLDMVAKAPRHRSTTLDMVAKAPRGSQANTIRRGATLDMVAEAPRADHDNMIRRGTAANIVGEEEFKMELPIGEHQFEVTDGLAAQLKTTPTHAIVQSAQAHLGAFFGLAPPEEESAVPLSDCLDLTGDGGARTPEEGAEAPAASATSSVELLTHLMQLATADDDCKDLFARLDAIRAALATLKQQAQHVDRMHQLGINTHAALAVAAHRLNKRASRTSKVKTRKKVKKAIPKLLQDYGAPRDDPDIAALAESLAREERAWCRNSAGQSATQQRRDLEARFGPRVERLRELLKRQTQEQIGSSIDSCLKLANVQMTANQLFKNVYDSITHKIRAVHPDSFREFGQLTRELRAKCQRENLSANQTSKDLLTLYCNGYRLSEQFTELLSIITKEVGGGTSMSVAPLKGLYRATEKCMLRSSNFLPGWGNRHDNSTTRDFRRGFVQGPSMRALILVLKACIAQQLAGEIVIVRIKDRFRNRTAGGWADAMINFYFADDATKHICELQLVHEDLMIARTHLGAHQAYSKGRAAEELLCLSQVAGGVSRDLPAMFGLWTEWQPMFDHWDARDGWLKQPDLSKWHGVKDVDEAGNVLELNLSHNDITGPMFPRSLAFFQKLRKLDLSGNHFHKGFSVPLFERLTSLVSLTLSYCEPQLRGPVPPEILELRNLEELDLSSNHLDLLPERFGDLVQLKKLILGDNPLKKLPESFQRLVNLEELDLSCLQLDMPGFPPMLLPLHKLKELELGDAFADSSVRTEPLSEGVGALKALQKFSVYNCGFTGPLPSALWTLAALEFLDLSSNQFSGALSASIGNLRRLQCVEMQINRFSGPIPAEICELEHCREMNLSEQGEWKILTQTAADGVEYKVIRRGRDTGGFTGPVPADIGRCRSLVSLSLHCNQLSGRVPLSLTQLAELRQLQLHNNPKLEPPPNCPANEKDRILQYETKPEIMAFFQCIQKAAGASVEKAGHARAESLGGLDDERLSKLRMRASSGDPKAKRMLSNLRAIEMHRFSCPQLP